MRWEIKAMKSLSDSAKKRLKYPSCSEQAMDEALN